MQRDSMTRLVAVASFTLLMSIVALGQGKQKNSPRPTSGLEKHVPDSERPAPPGAQFYVSRSKGPKGPLLRC